MIGCIRPHSGPRPDRPPEGSPPTLNHRPFEVNPEMNDIPLIRVFGKLALDMREFVALLPDGNLLLRGGAKIPLDEEDARALRKLFAPWPTMRSLHDSFSLSQPAFDIARRLDAQDMPVRDFCHAFALPDILGMLEEDTMTQKEFEAVYRDFGPKSSPQDRQNANLETLP